MSVRSSAVHTTLSLVGTEGELVSVRVCVEPRLLEDLLEALASVSFPINPQIYHHAGVGYVYPDGQERVISTTMVEFPAFSSQLGEVREVLLAHGLPSELAQVRSMIQNIHSGDGFEPAPAGVPYHTVNLYRHLPGTATTTNGRWPT